MKYPACKKLAIIQLVEQSPFPVRRTLERAPAFPGRLFLSLVRSVLQRRCTWGDRSPRPDRVWNRIADVVREPIIGLALAEPTPSPRTLARHFADTKLFRVKGFGLSPAEGARPDRQPRFHRHEGGR